MGMVPNFRLPTQKHQPVEYRTVGMHGHVTLEAVVDGALVQVSGQGFDVLYVLLLTLF